MRVPFTILRVRGQPSQVIWAPTEGLRTHRPGITMAQLGPGDSIDGDYQLLRAQTATTPRTPGLTPRSNATSTISRNWSAEASADSG